MTQPSKLVVPFVGTVYTHPDGLLTFVCAGVWQPGLFVDVAAIKAALRLSPDRMLSIWESQRPRPITADDMKGGPA